MRYILTLIGIFTGSILFAQTSDCDSISWSRERKLSWNDFKASPDTSFPDRALSSIRFQYKWKLSGDTVTISTSSYFRPCFAWSKVKNSDSLLVHEQGHFNISEYYRRLLVKRLSEQNFKRQNLGSEIQKIYRDVNDQQKIFSDLYEDKTDFGRIGAKQLEWSNKIWGMIESLNEYDNTTIIKKLTGEAAVY